MEASREEAASNALKPLLQMGLDRSNKLKSFEESQASLQGKLWINSYVDPVISHSNVCDFLLIMLLQAELKLNHLLSMMSLPVMKEERASQRKINSNLPQMKF